MPDTTPQIPGEAVEAVARYMQAAYETAGEEAERGWDEIDANSQEEWRGDARGALQAALPAIHKQRDQELRELLLSEEAKQAVTAARHREYRVGFNSIEVSGFIIQALLDTALASSRRCRFEVLEPSISGLRNYYETDDFSVALANLRTIGERAGLIYDRQEQRFILPSDHPEDGGS